MARKIDFATVQRLAGELGEVEQTTMHGSPALKVRGKLLACMAVHRSAEPGTLAMRMNLDQRAALLAEAPEVYYITEHYRSYPTLLVRLSRISLPALRELVAMAWRFVATSRGGTRSDRPKRRGGRASNQP